ncbi:MAG: hypothetical protein ACKVQR_23785 [Aquabacterium sp.]
MPNKLIVVLPALLAPAAWDKAKGTLAKTEETGVRRALVDLVAKHGAVDAALFDITKLTQLDVMVPRLALLEAQAKREVKAAVDQALAVVKLGKEAEATYKKSKLIPKSATKAANDVWVAAQDYAEALRNGAAAVIETLAARIVTAKEEADKASKSGGSGGPTAAQTKALKLVRSRTLPSLRIVRANNPLAPSPAFMGAIGPESSAVMLNKAVGGTERKLLATLLAPQKGIKFFKGEVVWEKASFTFVTPTPPGGAAKKLQEALKGLLKSKPKVRVRKPDGSVEEIGGDDNFDAALDDASKPKLPGDAVAQGKAIMTRLAGMKGGIDQAKLGGGKLAAGIEALVNAVTLALKGKDNAAAWDDLGRLEDLLAMAAPPSAEEAEAVKDVADEGKDDIDDAPPPSGGQPVGPGLADVRIQDEVTALDGQLVKKIDDLGKLLAAMPGEDAAVKLLATLQGCDKARKLALALSTPPTRLAALQKVQASLETLATSVTALAKLVKGRADLAKVLQPVKVMLSSAEGVINAVKEPTLKAALAKRAKDFRDEIAAAEKADDPAAAALAASNWLAEATTLKADADKAKDFGDWVESTWTKLVDAAESWKSSVAPANALARVQGFFDAAQQQYKDALAANRFDDIKNTVRPAMRAVYDCARGVVEGRRAQEGEFYLLLLRLEDLGDKATAALQNSYTDLKAEFDGTWPAGATGTAMLAGVQDYKRRFDAAKAAMQDAKAEAVGTAPDALKLQLERQIAAFKKVADKITDPTNKANGLKAHGELAKDLADALKLTDAKAKGKALLALEADLRLREKELNKLQIKEEVATPAGRKALEERIAKMGADQLSADPSDIAACEAALEVCFNIKVKTPEEMKKKGLPRMFTLMAKVPDWQANQKDTAQGKKALTEVLYGTEKTGDSNYYSPSRKLVSLNVDESVTEVYKPDNATDYKSETVKTFDVTTLHEVGHAVDEKIKFMAKRRGNNAFGGWKEETEASVLKALAEDSGFVGRFSGGAKKGQARDLKALVAYAMKQKKLPAKPAKATDPLGSLLDDWTAIGTDPVVAACLAGLRTKDSPWFGGKGRADKLKMPDGRVYQEAYDGSWNSYDHGSRNATGVNFYQWRSEAEWFAEIYAMYYMDKLGESHPMYSWFENEAKSEATAAAGP